MMNETTPARGRFITFEGIDGAGKSSQIDAVEAFLKGRGIEVVRTREPGEHPWRKKSVGCFCTMGWARTVKPCFFLRHVPNTSDR